MAVPDNKHTIADGLPKEPHDHAKGYGTQRGVGRCPVCHTHWCFGCGSVWACECPRGGSVKRQGFPGEVGTYCPRCSNGGGGHLHGVINQGSCGVCGKRISYSANDSGVLFWFLPQDAPRGDLGRWCCARCAASPSLLRVGKMFPLSPCWCNNCGGQWISTVLRAAGVPDL